MKAIAFAPAHITGFFEISMEENAGSRGAGICLSLGSYAFVEKIEEKKICIEGNVGNGEVTKKTIKNLGAEKVKVKIINELPFSQGFGISASSSLSSSLALCYLFNLPEVKAVEASHFAEIDSKTGLGDVVASYAGGIEIRKKPGLHGIIEKINCREKLIVAIVGKEIKTKEILNSRIVDKINEVGKECIKDFMKNKSLENFFEISLKFSFETGLADEKMKNLLKKANKIGMAGMCMLGNSIFAIYSEKMKKFLSKYEHYECFIDNEGARILTSFFP
ncbi:MAG TPA: hypothetical protein ENI33_03290 [Thermoplasmatales archaeon]|nr:hypothetical protein [Thermoplasmatales archaeon]